MMAYPSENADVSKTVNSKMVTVKEVELIS